MFVRMKGRILAPLELQKSVQDFLHRDTRNGVDVSGGPSHSTKATIAVLPINPKEFLPLEFGNLRFALPIHILVDDSSWFPCQCRFEHIIMHKPEIG